LGSKISEKEKWRHGDEMIVTTVLESRLCVRGREKISKGEGKRELKEKKL
jgi:hypothetical protein